MFLLLIAPPHDKIFNSGFLSDKLHLYFNELEDSFKKFQSPIIYTFIIA